MDATELSSRANVLVGHAAAQEEDVVDVLRALMAGDRRALSRLGVSGEVDFDPLTVEWAVVKDARGRFMLVRGGRDTLEYPHDLLGTVHTHPLAELPVELAPGGRCPLRSMLPAREGDLLGTEFDETLDFFASEVDVLHGLRGVPSSRILLPYRYVGQGQMATGLQGQGRQLEWVIDNLVDKGVDQLGFRRVDSRMTLRAGDEVLWQAETRSLRNDRTKEALTDVIRILVEAT